MRTRKKPASPEENRQTTAGATRNWYRDIPVKGACEKCGAEDPCGICEEKKGRSERAAR